jgi:hypothetical protein
LSSWLVLPLHRIRQWAYMPKCQESLCVLCKAAGHAGRRSLVQWCGWQSRRVWQAVKLCITRQLGLLRCVSLHCWPLHGRPLLHCTKAWCANHCWCAADMWWQLVQSPRYVTACGQEHVCGSAMTCQRGFAALCGSGDMIAQQQTCALWLQFGSRHCGNLEPDMYVTSRPVLPGAACLNVVPPAAAGGQWLSTG